MSGARCATVPLAGDGSTAPLPITSSSGPVFGRSISRTWCRPQRLAAAFGRFASRRRIRIAGIRRMPAPVCKPRFLQLAANALSDASFYDAPVCLQLNEFDEVQALVLKVMRSPGKRIVYPGCRFVVTGIFSEFHIREQPLWLWFKPDSAAQDGGLREGMRCTGNATDTTGATDRLAPSRGYFRRRTCGGSAVRIAPLRASRWPR